MLRELMRLAPLAALTAVIGYAWPPALLTVIVGAVAAFVAMVMEDLEDPEPVVRPGKASRPLLKGPHRSRRGDDTSGAARRRGGLS